MKQLLVFIALSWLSKAFASVSNDASFYLRETFDDEVDVFESKKWQLSKAEKYQHQSIKIKPSQRSPQGFENDKGLQIALDMKHYGVGTKLAKPFVFKENKELVIQYELKFDEAFNCGGAYIKLLRKPSSEQDVDVEAITNDSPYSIMFGPDRCGATNKVHFIVQYQNPVTQQWQEKHFNTTVPVRVDKETHLYTLVLRDNDDFTISVDDELVAKSGNLLTHMVPAINPPELIDDSSDRKPEDWVDEEFVDDVNAQKPDDWDETQPKKIVDPDAKKPADWLDEEPLQVPSPAASKPNDWDDEEDGEWEAPMVDNPKCEVASGCGPWQAPLISNPQYKGKWTAPKVKNPLFVGNWAPRKISNPEYFQHPQAFAHLASIEALVVEIWTTNAGIHFDNFVISSDADAVKQFTSNTFRAKNQAELRAKEQEKKSRQAQELADAFKTGDVFDKLRALGMDALLYAQDNPIVYVITALAIIVPFFLVLSFGGHGALKEFNAKNQLDNDTQSSAANNDDHSSIGSNNISNGNGNGSAIDSSDKTSNE